MNIEHFYRKRITHAELYSINIPCLSKLLNSVGENEKKIKKPYTSVSFVVLSLFQCKLLNLLM